MKVVEMKDLSLENDDDELGDDFQDASMDTIGTGAADHQPIVDQCGRGGDSPSNSVSTGVVFSPLVQGTFQRARDEFLLASSWSLVKQSLVPVQVSGRKQVVLTKEFRAPLNDEEKEMVVMVHLRLTRRRHLLW